MPVAHARLLAESLTGVGMSLDQANLAVCQTIALLVSLALRYVIPPHKVSASVRHGVVGGLGIWMVWFCFEWEVLYMVSSVFWCYICMRFLKATTSTVLVFIIAMGHLSFCHICRQVQFDGNYYIDISGPMMMLIQKLTSIGFNYKDGNIDKNERRTDYQRDHALEKLPTVLEYFGFMFYCQTVLCGPSSFYRDYRQFIDGSLFIRVNRAGDRIYEFPPVAKSVVPKLTTVMIFIVISLTVRPNYPIHLNIDDDFIRGNNIFMRAMYCNFSMLLCRLRYYVAWILGDALGNIGGLGFTRCDPHTKKPSWDLVTSVYFFDIEFATSYKTLVDNWNIQTGVWLRRVCYERVAFYPVMMTYILSAAWHGFFPGYYVCMVGALLLTISGRHIRRNVRPYFLRSERVHMAYDVATWFIQITFLNNIVLPFELLSWQHSIKFLRANYFFGHILPIVTIVFLLVWSKVTSGRQSSNKKRPSTKTERPNSTIATHKLSNTRQHLPFILPNNNSEPDTAVIQMSLPPEPAKIE